ncbi:hypothetical protein MRX96_005848 [Rhipicephalus microplus]
MAVTNLCLVSAQRLGVLGGGCVALATEDRCLLLLDLCLDSAHHYSDELRPASLVRLESVFSDDLPNISPVHGDPKHCFVPLCNLDDLAEVDEMAVSNGDMEVTCLQWLPQLSCLGIGLSCGTVHLWDIHKSSSKLVITLQSDLPVVSLAVQEPENDPPLLLLPVVSPNICRQHIEQFCCDVNARTDLFEEGARRGWAPPL